MGMVGGGVVRRWESSFAFDGRDGVALIVILMSGSLESTGVAALVCWGFRMVFFMEWGVKVDLCKVDCCLYCRWVSLVAWSWCRVLEEAKNWRSCDPMMSVGNLFGDYLLLSCGVCGVLSVSFGGVAVLESWRGVGRFWCFSLFGTCCCWFWRRLFYLTWC
ncbi:unnamed protein product [Amaranthus hypochondriacus]